MSGLSLNASILLIMLSFSYISTEAVSQLQITKFDVPPHARRNSNLLLTCQYDLKGQMLESVSWWFNSSEFYRHTENPSLSKEVFPIDSLDVDVIKSNSTALALKNLPLEATGFYKCIVNTDAPLFETKEEIKFLEVVVIPDESPTMDDIPEKGFHIGTTLRINCTSAPSKPASNLTFEANGRIVPSNHIKDYTMEETDDGLFITKATLIMKLKPHLLVNKKVNVACFSKIEGFEMASTLAVVRSSGQVIQRSLEILLVCLMILVGR